MKLLIASIALTFSQFAAAQTLPVGIEWMKSAQSKTIAPQIDQQCTPVCSGVAGNTSLEGWQYATQAEVQALLDQVGPLGIIDYMGSTFRMTTTYSNYEALNSKTYSVDPVSGAPIYLNASFSTTPVSVAYDAGFSTSADLSAGRMLYRNSNQLLQCVYNGMSLQSGSEVTAFQTAVVPYGSTCVSQKRVCSGTTGLMSGTFTNASCTVAPPANCTLNGATILHGQQVPSFATATVDYGMLCKSSPRTCVNGKFNAQVISSCTVLPKMKCKINGKGVKVCEPDTATKDKDKKK